jgi:hypothetical protein
MVDHDDSSCRRTSLDNRTGVSSGRCQWLLDKHVRTHGERCKARVTMRVIGCRNRHRFGMRFPEHLVNISIGCYRARICGAPGGRKLLGTAEIEIDDGDKVC